jgi:hypothetical protein
MKTKNFFIHESTFFGLITIFFITASSIMNNACAINYW